MNSLSVADVNIYPNPSEGEITIDCSKLNVENAQIEVMDVTGKTMANYKLDSNLKVQINLDSYANGVYQVKIHTEDSTIIKQFIKK